MKKIFVVIRVTQPAPTQKPVFTPGPEGWNTEANWTGIRTSSRKLSRESIPVPTDVVDFLYLTRLNRLGKKILKEVTADVT